MKNYFSLVTLASLMSLSASCAPTVKVEAPDKPIVIDLNIKIEHKVRVEIDRDLDNIMKKEKGIF